MLKTVAIVFVTFLLNGGFTAFMRNKYVSEVENILACPNNDQMMVPFRNLKFFRFNRTHKSLNYEFTYSRALDEKIGGSVIADRWGDGGWITIPFLGFQPNICKYMNRFFKSFWVPFYANVGVAHPDRCPIPSGNYSVKNYMVDTTQISIPFFSGRFRFTSLFQDADTKQPFQCIMHIIKITEMF